MASSPVVQKRLATAPGALGARRRGGGTFSESASRTAVGLAKVEVQLQKELGKLERQAQTAVNNIANHQQAMKMSWRRLEHQREKESPLLSRAGQRSPLPSSPGQRQSILSSNTKLYVGSTPSAYREGKSRSISESILPDQNSAHGGRDQYDSQSSTHQSPPTSRTSLLRSSPYLSSPFPIRRGLHQPAMRAPPTPGHHLLTSSTSVGSGMALPQTAEQGHASHSESELKLPPIRSSSPQPPLVAPTHTVDKATLMKASTDLELLPLASSSQGQANFRAFYSANRAPSQTLPLSPLHTAHTHVTSTRDLEQPNERRGLVRSSSESSLAELFEQIKHCRYIRHYHPDGRALEEY